MKINHKIIAWGLALIVLLQNPPWPLWNYGLILGYLLSFVLFSYLYCTDGKTIFLKGITKKKLPILFISFCFLFIAPLIYGFRLSTVFIFLTYILLFRIDTSDLSLSFHILTNVIAVIILISLPFWFIHVFVYELPTFGILDISEMKGAAYVLNNHILFLTYDGLDFFRFYSVFDEPGVLGTLAAFILFGNKYNFRKWQNVVILLGGIFTYSMAFYVLSLVGYVYYSIHSLKKFVKSFIAILILSFIVFVLLKDNLAFSLSIVERFQDFGLDRINNRTGDAINQHFDDMFLTPSIFLGEGASFLSANGEDIGASYKLFIIEYGLLGTLSLFLMYYSLIKQKTREVLFLLFFFSLSFLQRPYAFTSWQLVVFAAIIAALDRSK